MKKLLATIALLFHLTIFAQTPDSSRFGIFGAYAQEYDYFKIQMGFNDTQYWNWVDNHFENLGAHWTRSKALIWDLIEPDLDGNYFWNIFTKPDSVITNIYNSPAQVEWLGGVGFPASRNPLNYRTQYKAYLRAVVERYNGDGLNDLNSYVKVKYWQIGNEIFKYINAGFSSAQYAQIVAIADTAIHSIDANAKICLVAPTKGHVIDTFLVNTIKQLGLMNINVDVIDIHHWGLSTNYKMKVIPTYRTILDSNGYSNVKIWSCENGTYCYQPFSFPYQSQQVQAASLIKRYVWNFANGLDKLMWNNLMEFYNFNGNSNSIYNSMGLLGDGQLNNEPINELNYKRKSYYSYKFLASTIDSYYATFLFNNTFHNEPNGNYGYTYLDNVTADNFDIFWTDNDSATYTFTIASNFQLSEMVPYDTIGTFNSQIFASGTHSITIYKDQVYLLKKSLPTGFRYEETQKYSVAIYPNPFSMQTVLQMDKVLKNATLTIYNSYGQTVREIKYISGQTIILQRDNLPSGLYFIWLKEGNKIITADKIVITD